MDLRLPDFDDDDDDLPDLEDIDYNDPSHFAKLFGSNSAIPIPSFKSPDDVRKEASERSGSIHDTYNKLRAIIERHEETIQKRWTKRTRQQRLKILLDCWPGMAATHRPDFDAWKRESGRNPGRRQGTSHPDHFMWPYINQEDMSKPKTLLLLLNARARHHPSHFAAADITAIRFGLVTRSIVPIFLNGYVMVLNGANDAHTYGELLSWDDHPDAFDWMHTQRQFLPGEGLLVLEIQERIMKFLLDCCKAILPDISADKLTSGAYPVRPEPYLKTEAEVNGFESLAIMAAETPYRPPARIDFAQMESLLEARASAAKDHIWALREDPDYFAGHITDIREHRQEMLKDTMGKPHPAFRSGRGDIVIARVIGNMVTEAYAELEIFTELHRQARQLHLLHEKYASQLSPTEDLPAEFLDALLTFRHYLNQAVKAPMGQLRVNVPASPPIRRLFVRQPPPNATTPNIVVMTRPGQNRTKVEGQLLWLLPTFWEDGDSLFFAGVPLILDELQRLLEAEPEAADLVSSRVAEIISSASIIGQCIGGLDQYQPWARGFENAKVGKADGIQKAYSVWSGPLSSLITGAKDKDFIPVADLGDTSHRRFFYPTEKRRTKENIEALRSAERNLDGFWRAVDKIVDVKCDHLRGTAVRTLLSENRVLQRTPEWVDDNSLAKNKQQQQVAVAGGVESLFLPLSTLYFNKPGQEAGQDKPSMAAKAKAKTKGQSKDPSTQLPTTSEQADNKKTVPSPIQVDNRALKVFRTLFFNPGATSSPGEVAWHDFVYAMTSTGLFAAEKLYGSAWQFERSDDESQTRIQFHQPHPRGRIPFTMARRMGRRLNRAFGWVGETFVPKGDGKA